MKYTRLHVCLMFGLFGLLEGLALYGLDKPFMSDYPFLTHMFQLAIVFIALNIQLSYQQGKIFQLVVLSMVIGSCFGLAYSNVYSADHYFSAQYYLALVMLIISMYITNIFYQVFHASGRWHFSSTALFTAAWNTFFSIVLSLFFALLCWGILYLALYLFKIVDINIRPVLSSDLFVFISTPCFFGVGLGLLMSQQKTIVACRDILFSIAYVLLPVLALIGLFFMAGHGYHMYHRRTLFFITHATGVNNILVWMSILLIIALNAVIQDGKVSVNYPHLIKKIISACVVISPIFMGYVFWDKCAYWYSSGLYVSYFIEWVVSGLLLLYLLAYACAVFQSSSVWLGSLPRINTYLSCLVVIVALFLHTPWVRDYIVKQNVARLKQGDFSHIKDMFFYQADLQSMKFSGDLAYLNFSYANLSKADFQKARLSGATFQHANLTNAQLQKADLSYADFSFADVSGTDFHGAVIDRTLFEKVSGFTQAQLDSTKKSCDPWKKPTLPPGLLWRCH